MTLGNPPSTPSWPGPCSWWAPRPCCSGRWAAQGWAPGWRPRQRRSWPSPRCRAACSWAPRQAGGGAAGARGPSLGPHHCKNTHTALYLILNSTYRVPDPKLHTVPCLTWNSTHSPSLYLTLNSTHSVPDPEFYTHPCIWHTMYLTLNFTHSVPDPELYTQPCVSHWTLHKPCTWPRTLHTELYLTLNSTHSLYLTLNSAHSPVPDPDLYIQPVPNPELTELYLTQNSTHIVPDLELYTQPCIWPRLLSTAPYLTLNRRNLYNIMTVWLLFLKF